MVGWMDGWMGGWVGGCVELRLKLTQPPIGVGAELGNRAKHKNKSCVGNLP